MDGSSKIKFHFKSFDIFLQFALVEEEFIKSIDSKRETIIIKSISKFIKLSMDKDPNIYSITMNFVDNLPGIYFKFLYNKIVIFSVSEANFYFCPSRFPKLVFKTGRQ